MECDVVGLREMGALLHHLTSLLKCCNSVTGELSVSEYRKPILNNEAEVRPKRAIEM